MLLSKLNSVGAIFISWSEAADVIRRIARRESVAKGWESSALPALDQPSCLSLSLFATLFILLPVLLRCAAASSPYTPVSLYLCTRSFPAICSYSNTELFIPLFLFHPLVLSPGQVTRCLVAP